MEYPPCEECISLAMCINQKEIRCSILLDHLNNLKDNTNWNTVSNTLNKTLRGNWCTVGMNNVIYLIEKDRTDSSRNFR